MPNGHHYWIKRETYYRRWMSFHPFLGFDFHFQFLFSPFSRPSWNFWQAHLSLLSHPRCNQSLQPLRTKGPFHLRKNKNSKGQGEASLQFQSFGMATLQFNRELRRTKNRDKAGSFWTPCPRPRLTKPSLWLSKLIPVQGLFTPCPLKRRSSTLGRSEELTC